MKQSVGLVILQVFGIVLGLFSVFWIAGSLSAEVYAVMGIYNIISALIVVFSNTGLETYAIRNVLSWKEEGQENEIKLIVTQAIVYRTILAVFIVIPLIAYVSYISVHKFNGQYFGLFNLMVVLSITAATNDATILILRSFNKYFAAALATNIIGVFGRLLALLLFMKYGFNVYIYIIILLPLIVTLPILYMLRNWISFHGVFERKNIVASFKSSKSFALSSYISYVFNYLDQLLVSIFLSPAVLGSFSVGKSIFSIAKSFIENIYDPLIQGLVSVKNDIIAFHNKLNRIFKINNIILIVSIFFIPIVIYFINDILSLMRLEQYPLLNYYVVFIYLSQVVHIGLKVKYNFICLFFPQSYYLKLTSISAVLTVVLFVVSAFIDIKLLFLHMLVKNLVMLWYSGYEYNSSINPFKQ